MTAEPLYNLLPHRERRVRRRRRAIVCEWALAAFVGAVLGTAHAWDEPDAVAEEGVVMHRSTPVRGAGAAGEEARRAEGDDIVPAAALADRTDRVREPAALLVDGRQGSPELIPRGQSQLSRVAKVLDAVAGAAATRTGVILDALTVDGTRIAFDGHARETRHIAHWLEVLRDALRGGPVSLDAIERHASYVRFAAHTELAAGAGHD
ncbi:putative PilN domain-containing protein [Pararobbsia alpina]|uniref:hypothetical protein n=1 Tax=Pararobbsia alpina TaxID=621374 RepID=UPI0039A4411A